MIDQITTINPIVTGKKFFQVRYIKWSYRIRGIVARTHTNSVAKNIVLNTSSVLFMIKGLDSLPKNRTAEVILINRMLVYSAMKISANSPLLYSVLNPDTSSDSPSAKSNGVRFVSANVVVNHIRRSGAARRATHDF